jgi:uncharacterized protein (DUF58 family)
MRRAFSPKVSAYAALGGLGLVAALVLRRPEVVALAAPFATALAVGLSRTAEPALALEASLDRELAVEGEEVTLTVRLEAAEAVDRLVVRVREPRGLEVASGTAPQAFALDAGEARELRFEVRCRRWGAYRLGTMLVRAQDRFGAVAFEQELDRRRPLKVFPRREALRSLVRPFETQVFAGDELSRRKGEGIEFADLRPFAFGDGVRRINWRASARRNELWVNERHPERNTDVVLFLDSFAEAGEPGRSTLDAAVRAAASLAARYLARRDRVALVTFGGTVRWLLPSMGTAQLYRIVDALLQTQIELSYALKDVDVLPRRTLPPQALVVALTPFLDERSIRALIDLRARGFDLAIVELSPLPLAVGSGEAAPLAVRLWRLQREVIRSRLEELGVPVVQWAEGKPLEVVVEEARAFRRYARRARA